jgi:Predicted O-methyltransferase
MRAFPSVRRRHGTPRGLRLALHEILFDVVHGTDTSIELPDPTTPLGSASRSGHEASNPLVFMELIRRVPVVPQESVFLDLGAGKGRALLLAGRHGFRRAIGVEISPALCRIAGRNVHRALRRHPGTAIEVHCADAGGFDIPDAVEVVYLYNPFPPPTLSRVIERITASLRRAPRRLFVVYAHSRHHDLLLEAGFVVLHRQDGAGMVLIRYPPV